MQFLKSFSFTAVFVAALAVSASAHHSHGNYDISTWSIYEGTVKELYLVRPHSWVYVEITDDAGTAAVWAIEAGGPEAITRSDVGTGDVRPGDTISVRCHRLLDGSNGCLLGFVTPMHGDMARGHGIEREWD